MISTYVKQARILTQCTLLFSILGSIFLYALVASSNNVSIAYGDVGSQVQAATGAAAASSTELTSDFNGDGYEDLAIGVNEDKGDDIATGAVNVLYGSPASLQTASPRDQFWTQDSAGVNDVAERDDNFGRSLAAGDFNNDGYDDLAIGVPDEGFGDRTHAGAVHILYGSASGLQTSSPNDQFWHQNSPGVADFEENRELFGWSLAVADFNRDGYDDLAIGVMHESIGNENPIVSAGAVHVLYGSSAGLRTSAAGDGTGRTDQFWHS